MSQFVTQGVASKWEVETCITLVSNNVFEMRRQNSARGSNF